MRPAAGGHRKCCSRGGGSPELANLCPPGTVLDKVRPGRWSATRQKHLSAQESGLEFVSGFPTAEGGTGSRHRGELARAEGKEEGEGARCGPYHPRVLRRRLEAGDRWRRGGIGVAPGSVDGGMAAQEHGGNWGRRWRLRGNTRELSRLRRVGRPRRAGRSRNGPRASR
jgi:hypothetical protein